MPKRNKKCKETKGDVSPPPARCVLESLDVCTHEKRTSSCSTANNHSCPKCQERKEVATPSSARRILVSSDVCIHDKRTSSSSCSTANKQPCPKCQERKEVATPPSARRVLVSSNVCTHDKRTSSSSCSTANNQPCPKCQERKEVATPPPARRILESFDVCTHDKRTSSSCGTANNQPYLKPPCCRIPSVALCAAETETCHDTISGKIENTQCPTCIDLGEEKIQCPTCNDLGEENIQCPGCNDLGEGNIQCPGCIDIDKENILCPGCIDDLGEDNTPCPRCIDEDEQNTECHSCNDLHEEFNDFPPTNTCCPGGVQIKTLKDAMAEFKRLESCSEDQGNTSSKLSGIPVSRKQSNIDIKGITNKGAVPKKVPDCPPTTCLRTRGKQKDVCPEPKPTSKEKCCSSPVCGFPKDEGKTKENLTCSELEVKEDGNQTAPIEGAIEDVVENKSQCHGVCATSNKQTTSVQKCECHFPPAFNKGDGIDFVWSRVAKLRLI